MASFTSKKSCFAGRPLNLCRQKNRTFQIKTYRYTANSTVRYETFYEIHRFGKECFKEPNDMFSAVRIVARTSSEKIVIVEGINETSEILAKAVKSAVANEIDWIDHLNAFHYKYYNFAIMLLGINNDEYNEFFSFMIKDVRNITEILKAIATARTESDFGDLVISYSELWCAKLFKYACDQYHASKHEDIELRVAIMDTRDIVVVNHKKDVLHKSCDNKTLLWYSEQCEPHVIVATEHLAKTDYGKTTRIGNNAICAVLASIFQVSKVVLWTDHNGVYSADPSIVSDARCLEKISFEDARHLINLPINQEDSNDDNEVIISSIDMIYVRNMFNQNDKGTTIINEENIVLDTESTTLHPYVTGFSLTKNVDVIIIQFANIASKKTERLSNTCSILGEGGVEILMINGSSYDNRVNILVRSEDREKVNTIFETPHVQEQLNIQFYDLFEDCSIINAYGYIDACIVSCIIGNMASKSIYEIISLSLNDSSRLDIVVKTSHADDALRAAHYAYYDQYLPIIKSYDKEQTETEGYEGCDNEFGSEIDVEQYY